MSNTELTNILTTSTKDTIMADVNKAPAGGDITTGGDTATKDTNIMVANKIPFSETPLEDRKREADRILKKYPDRIPVLVKLGDNKLKKLEKEKFLIPIDCTISGLQHTLRKRFKLNPDEAMYMFINNRVCTGVHTIGQVYKSEKSDDGFLRVVLTAEATFG